MDSLDNHPIPQDVTHFQFRLIGDMTIKQFGYLAAGFAIAWFCFAIPLFILLKVILVPGFAILGIVLAFIPIEGRPADTIIKNFIRALFLPNQYIFQKSSGDQILSELLQTPAAVVQPQIPLTQSPIQPVKPQIQTSQSTVPQGIFVVPQTPIAPMPMPIDPSQMAQRLETSTTPNLTNQIPNPPVQKPEVKPEAISSQQQPNPIETHEDREALSQLHQEQVAENPVAASAPSPATQPQPQTLPTYKPLTIPEPPPAQFVKKIPEPKKVGIPATIDVPNIIMGIVKDPRGNVLPNVLIEVKDQDNKPVRAFKTNQLGQFASATPLVNGKYTITFEDTNAKHTFGDVEVVTDGTILTPIEVTSIDERENLRKELFGDKAVTG